MIDDKEFQKFEDGFFKPLFEKFITFKRSKGEKVAQSTLLRLKKLNSRLNSYHTEVITQQMVTEILRPEESLSEIERAYMVSSLRQFCDFLCILGYESAQVSPRYMRSPRCEFRPYIFSNEELRQIASAADNLPASRRTNSHQQTYPVLTRLLMGTGMRIGETLALTRGDVDCDNGIIHVRNGKNGVSRYIPVSESLQIVLNDYSKSIDISERKKPFFVSSYTGEAMSYDAMKYLFPKIFKMAGITERAGRKPTIHSIRHTFCTRSLAQMLDKGMDIYTAIPLLAAYVGHVNYADTEKYIHFTEQDHESFIKEESILGALIPEVPNA